MLFKKLEYFLPVAVVFIFISGCTGVISDQVRKQAVENLSLAAALDDTQESAGKMVIWAGEIISTRNEEKGTVIEIIQKPADSNQRPRESDQSQGRFLALNKGYLDSVIYEKGRKVTVAGRIKEKQTLPLDGIQYTYPVIMVEEIYLWPRPETCPDECFWYPCQPFVWPYYPYGVYR